MAASVVAIAAHKGGVGKTVTALAVGASLARSSVPTLVIDCDPQGHAGAGLGIVPTRDERTLQNLLETPPAPARDIIRQTHLSHLSLIPSSIRMSMFERYLDQRGHLNQNLRF